MALFSFVANNIHYFLATFIFLVPAYHVLLFLIDKHGIRSIPGPWIAALSDAWLAYWAAKGLRSENVHQLHLKYGRFVRIAPNHVSISDPDALPIVYAHGNGTLKSEFYDAFVARTPGLFNTRSRVVHTRKRKLVSHVFSPKHVLEFETNVRSALTKFLAQWDRLCQSAPEKQDRRRPGWTYVDALPWFNFLAFDIIGDLAFGQPFGMVDAGRDIAPVAVSLPTTLSTGDGAEKTTIINIPAVEILNKRGDFNASIGVLPKWLWPLVKRIPWYAQGAEAVQRLTGLAVAAVERRLADPASNERGDLLAKLQEGRDDAGNPMGKEELVAESLTQLIAGSDTTSNASSVITFHLAKYPSIQRKLQAELDDVLGPLSQDADADLSDCVVLYETVKKCQYLEACINESLRLHSASAMGLPRVVPPGEGLEVCGRWFKEGTVLSVPSYSIHRDPAVWGEDVEVFRPERWQEEDAAKMATTFNPFSYGPRGCVGRNLAVLELFVITATVFRRYECVLEDPDEVLRLREGFLRKPPSTRIWMRRRAPVA